MRLSQTPIYRAWWHMMRRCYNPKDDRYHLYGARGISVCAEWHDFKKFYADMSPRPEGLTLDRIDCNKGYSKDNCRWADIYVQANNKRNSANITVEGTRYTVTEAARKFGVPYPRLRYLIVTGWSPERAIAALQESPNGLVKTHCRRGHEWTLENTLRAKAGYRLCRTCKEIRENARRTQFGKSA